jgi:uracil-DNA glycosylase family 4
LVELRSKLRRDEPTWFNSPVPTFGPLTGRLAIVGLAPGMRGANRTGRPFTGDFAGLLLYETLLEFGFAAGRYEERPDDGLVLRDCCIVNSVRCLPPENKPTPAEIRTCSRTFLDPTLGAMHELRFILALGRIAHESVLRAFGRRLAAHPFGHAKTFVLPETCGRELMLFDSYHCSRYNTNTRVLTPEMFRAVFGDIRARLDAAR